MTLLGAVDPPALPGVYLLWFAVPRPLSVAWRRDSLTLLSPGVYVYVGSALGPGGLQARLRRHTGDPTQRRVHWHIDHLTARVAPAAIRYMPTAQRRECQWVQTLAEAGAWFPVPGFGSSDCRQRCPAHLLALPASWSLLTLETLLP